MSWDHQSLEERDILTSGSDPTYKTVVLHFPAPMLSCQPDKLKGIHSFYSSGNHL